eukprot:gnl/Chilomastix_cuspidata/3170.p1 GENE.gnl/Chilomastix_cuspidata/3170~~gnl/Chilomastix_cuspidata/3170.p1  ORF type:complete len:567 (-),score=191.55 gnl/Chilomastix_cuspidata/3170:215-1915(-)
MRPKLVRPDARAFEDKGIHLKRRNKSSFMPLSCVRSPEKIGPNVFDTPLKGPSSILFARKEDGSCTLQVKKVPHSELEKNYEVEADIGFGNFSSVHKVCDLKTRLRYALKISEPFKTEKHRADLMREIFALSRLAHSPRTVPDSLLRCHRAWIEGNRIFLLTDLFGNTVRALTANGRILPDAQIRVFCTDILRALDFIHSAGFVHLDVKPENIFLRDDTSAAEQVRSPIAGRAAGVTPTGFLVTPHDAPTAGAAFEGLDAESMHFVLGDFGLCRTPSAAFESDEGDSRYLAPELLKQNKATPSADIFSFGVSLYELLSDSDMPLSGPSWQALRSTPSVDELVAACPLEWPFEFFEVVHLCLRPAALRPTARTLLARLDGATVAGRVTSPLIQRLTPNALAGYTLRSKIMSASPAPPKERSSEVFELSSSEQPVASALPFPVALLLLPRVLQAFAPLLPARIFLPLLPLLLFLGEYTTTLGLSAQRALAEETGDIHLEFVLTDARRRAPVTSLAFALAFFACRVGLSYLTDTRVAAMTVLIMCLLNAAADLSGLARPFLTSATSMVL